MRKAGYHCQVVEHWNPFARIRQDLFGIIDIVCVKDGETVGVQTTSIKGVPARRTKIFGSPYYPILRRAGWIVVLHGWLKNEKNRWEVKIENL